MSAPTHQISSLLQGLSASVAMPGTMSLQTLLQLPPPAAQDPTTASATTPSTDDHSACAPAKLWALGVLSATYVHQAAVSAGIPVMLPMISNSLTLSDFQGALLTSGYTCMYALVLIPAGMLADRVKHRPALLGASVAAWSALGLAASNAQGFTELMLSRVGLAVAQSTQNVVCFSVIPDLFPKHKSTALALYNCAIYCGRGLIYLTFNAARNLMASVPEVIDATAQQLVLKDMAGNLLVPMDKLDLRLVQLVYVTGDMAAIRATSPLYGLSEMVDAAGMAETAGLANGVWRQVLEKLTLPGMLLAAALLLTVPEPANRTSRHSEQQQQQREQQLQAEQREQQAGGAAAAGIALPHQAAAGSATATLPTQATLPAGVALPAAAAWPQTSGAVAAAAASGAAASRPAAAAAAAAAAVPAVTGGAVIWKLLTCGPFMATTCAAALNDVASYAMIAWQSTFYERVYHLGTADYAPVLATLLPLSGILGGVGGGLLADRLTLTGHRAWVTVATSLLAAPLMWASLTAPTAEESFLYLGLGFALSEAWRAPSAIMAKSVVPTEQSSTAMSLYLCVRNVIGGLGPILVAHMSHVWNLQAALQILPGMYIASGALFWKAEQLLAVYAQENGAQQLTPETQP